MLDALTNDNERVATHYVVDAATNDGVPKKILMKGPTYYTFDFTIRPGDASRLSALSCGF